MTEPPSNLDAPAPSSVSTSAEVLSSSTAQTTGLPSSAPAETPSTESLTSQPNSQPSYVKLAMRNMVRKRGTSLYHFALTVVGLVTVLVGLAYLTR